MASVSYDMESVSTGSNFSNIKKHICIIPSYHWHPDRSCDTLVGVGVTLPTPRVICNDSKDVKAKEDIVVDVSDDASAETETKKKKATTEKEIL
jgi:hypothetical protein